METLVKYTIICGPLLIALYSQLKIESHGKRVWIIALVVSVLIAFFVWKQEKKFGKPVPSFALSNGQTYEVLRHFEENGISIAYLAPATIRFSDYSYSRNGEPRFYAIDGAVPTNRIVVAFTESKWGYLRPVDHGTNEFHLSQ